MKKCVVLLWILLLAAPCLAQTSRVEDEQGSLVWLDFDESIPQEAEQVFEAVLREGDRILCGALQVRRMQREGILAVERSGKVLLMGACCPNGETMWRTVVEADGFFLAGTAIDITTEPIYDGLGQMYDRRLLITCGEERYGIGLYENGTMRIETFERREVDGSLLCITLNSGWIGCDRYTDDLREMLYSTHGVIPSRLAAWTHESFPKDEQDVRRISEAYPLELNAGEVFVSGGNLREEPTGSAVSWGQYCAKANVLDKKMGLIEPWIQVQIGQLTGWVSDNYVFTQEDDPGRLYSAASAMAQVARVDEPIVMYTFPGGQEGITLPTGTLMHVLMENDGWLHVIYPQVEIAWQTDWDGAYGFIRSEEAVVGVSIADAMWK